MWKLKEIEAHNICAFKELSYVIHQGVTTLIYGDNRDNESQRSNGSGKSALIESIALGITGSPLRKIKNEEIINDQADNCFVRLVFDNESSKELLTIEREFSRRGAATVKCQLVINSKVADSNEVVHSSLEQYNKYILEKLGVTKDEIFNNFILCKHKYKEFLSSSDKEKKEIINRFSNGVIVDDAISKIEEDIVPIQNDLNVESLEFAGVEGRIKMLEEQIEQESDDSGEKARTKQQKIAELESSITQKRVEIKDCKSKLLDIKTKNIEVQGIDNKVQDIESSEISVIECYEALQIELSAIGALSDWSSLLSGKKDTLTESNIALESLNQECVDAETKLKELTENQQQIGLEYQKLIKELRVKEVGYSNEQESLSRSIEDATIQINNFRKQCRRLSTDIETLKSKIAGTISCPECSHKFLVSDVEFDITRGDAELTKMQSEQQNITIEITDKELVIIEFEAAQNKIAESRRTDLKSSNEFAKRVATATQFTESAESDLEGAKLKQQRTMNTISALQAEVDSMRRKVFDEAFELIDTANSSSIRDVKKINEEIKSFETSIETLRSTIEDINSTSATSLIDKLSTSLKLYRAESTKILQKKSDIDKRLLHLQEQQGRFTQFKTFLANTKIEALSSITNEFLEGIGSDIRIRFSGYTVLKTGKVREKISISLLRDGIDIGSFGKLSAGEAARVNLSSILAMQKLVNSNCDSDKGLDLLILDEILDACDESGLTSMLSALNSFGTTALVISHGNTAESYPHKLVIIKESGESRVEK